MNGRDGECAETFTPKMRLTDCSAPTDYTALPPTVTLHPRPHLPLHTQLGGMPGVRYPPGWEKPVHPEAEFTQGFQERATTGISDPQDPLFFLKVAAYMDGPRDYHTK